MSTKITTGKVRLSYCNLFTPKVDNQGAKPKYSATLLISKRDNYTIDKIRNAVKEAKELFVARGGQLSGGLKTTVYDGDGERPNGGRFGEECKGHYVLNVSTYKAPQLVDIAQQPITNEHEIYSGCYARAIINFYVYDRNGNKGISAGLNAIMKLYDGEALGGVVVTSKDWDDGWEDDSYIL